MQTMLLRLCQIHSMNQIILRALKIRLAIYVNESRDISYGSCS